MTPISVMVNGLPGNMAREVCEEVIQNNDFRLIPASLTGPEIALMDMDVLGQRIALVGEDSREESMKALIREHDAFITVDYTHPEAVNENAGLYASLSLPFVMGTTGGDREKLHHVVENSGIPAVIAPNMAKQIVGFQAMIGWCASHFPNLFAGYRLEIKESHQKNKADTSGTAKSMVEYFNSLGIDDFTEKDIIRERDPHVQKTIWGIPEAHIDGHGWHTYTLLSPDETVTFKFTHNVCGRKVYAKGTLDAVRFLDQKIKKGNRGIVYSMVDVLQGG